MLNFYHFFARRDYKTRKLMQKAGISLELVAQRDEPTGYVTVKLSNGEPDFTIHQGVAWDHIELSGDKAPPGRSVVLRQSGTTNPGKPGYGETITGRRGTETAVRCEPSAALLQCGNSAGRSGGRQSAEVQPRGVEGHQKGQLRGQTSGIG